MDNEESLPSRWNYVLAGIVFVGGWVTFAVYLFSSLSGMGSKLQQVVVPGRVTLTLRDKGNYTIFHEYRTVVGNKVYSTEQQLPGLECVLASKTTGARVPLIAATSGSYEVGSRAGISVFDFSIQAPGEYELSASYPAGQQGPEVVLAVGHDFNLAMMNTVFGSLAIVFSSMAISAALTIYTAFKRWRAVKRMKAGSRLTPFSSQG